MIGQIGAQRAAQAQVKVAGVRIRGDFAVAWHGQRNQPSVGELRESTALDGADVAGRTIAALRIVKKLQAALLAG